MSGESDDERSVDSKYQSDPAFRHDPETYESVGEAINDTQQVQECLHDAVTHFHGQLPDEKREWITDKWGISDEMIDSRCIGYEKSGNHVVESLVESGYDILTIARAGIGTSPLIKHIIECGAVSETNAHLGSQSGESNTATQAASGGCPHTEIPVEIDKLVVDRLNNRLEEEDIDLETAVSYAKTHTDWELSAWSWWDNRIIFPYRDSDEDFCYLIGRATDNTDDKVYSNGIQDRTGRPVTTLSDTVFADAVARERDTIPPELLSEFIVLPHAVTEYNSPHKDEYAEFTESAFDMLEQHTSGESVSESQLQELGVIHSPEVAESLRDSSTTLLHVLPSSATDSAHTPSQPGQSETEQEYVVSPPAIGVTPGTDIEVVNHTDESVAVNTHTPSQSQQSDEGEQGSVVSLQELQRHPDEYDGEQVTISGVVTELFDLSDAQSEWMAQRGVIADESGSRLFTIPEGAIEHGSVESVEIGSAYELSDATGSVYQGDVQLKVGRGATVRPQELTATPSDTRTVATSNSGTYRLSIDVGEERHRAIAVASAKIETNNRRKSVEAWVSDEPTFAVDMPKYLKQTIDRSWINHDAIQEPIFGIETIHEDTPLLVTEGVTDAITAHQHGIPCIAPATTNFKKHHYEEICRLAEDVSFLIVVNDSELNNAGVNGALRTAAVIENDGHTVGVGEMPLPDGERKMDVAKYLQRYGKESFVSNVLDDSIEPTVHPLYDAERHDPTHHQTHDHDYSDTWNDGESGSDSSLESSEIDGETANVSQIYTMSLGDVLDIESLKSRSGVQSGSTIYRGQHPIQHHGNSTGYFVVRSHTEFITAKDYKIESSGDAYGYNQLTWLATAAQCDCSAGKACGCTRSVTRPMGSLSHSEVWWAWHHAKKADHIEMPADDPIPVKAIWHLTSKYGLLREESIPESFDDALIIPPTVFNRVLDKVKSEYGLNPGREEKVTK